MQPLAVNAGDDSLRTTTLSWGFVDFSWIRHPDIGAPS